MTVALAPLPANCPIHGRDHLANAGAPNVVRCIPSAGCATGVLERCRTCRATGTEGGRSGGKTCPACQGYGWKPRGSHFGSPYPVS